MKVFNGTAHQINIYTLDQTDQTNPRKLILLNGQEPCHVIPAGTNLNCVKVCRAIDSTPFGFPVTGAVEFTNHDELPEGFDIYVVSQLFRAAVVALGGDTAKLATVNGVVYSDPTNPRPCGCLGLAIG